MRDSLCINKLRFTIVETLHTDYFFRTKYLNITKYLEQNNRNRRKDIFTLSGVVGMKCYSVGWVRLNSPWADRHGPH